VAPSEYILIGGGQHAGVVLDVLLSLQVKVHAVYDPKYSGKLFGIDQLGDYQPDSFSNARAIVAIGNNATRKKVSQSVKHSFGQAIHSSSQVSSFAIVGEGTVLFHNCIIQANAKVGNHVIINTGAQADHDCVIDDYAHLAPGVILCGTVEIGEGTLVGAGATIIPGIKVGRWSVIAAGAVVTQNVPDNTMVAGVPARVIKSIPQ
jgi:sugar O-acyltransferase (sialic acid O-acetyltransferase NeuD family)